MSFSYALSTDVGKVRLELGDTVSGAGVKPDNSNFSDEELQSWINAEDSHIMHTVTRACESLARMWSNMANVTIGPRSEGFGKISADWAARAKELRQQYGDPGGGSAFSVGLDRVDGYSAAADASGLE